MAAQVSHYSFQTEKLLTNYRNSFFLPNQGKKNRQVMPVCKTKDCLAAGMARDGGDMLK
jgi:hypothetical protein